MHTWCPGCRPTRTTRRCPSRRWWRPPATSLECFQSRKDRQSFKAQRVSSKKGDRYIPLNDLIIEVTDSVANISRFILSICRSCSFSLKVMDRIQMNLFYCLEMRPTYSKLTQTNLVIQIKLFQISNPFLNKVDGCV